MLLLFNDQKLRCLTKWWSNELYK